MQKGRMARRSEAHPFSRAVTNERRRQTPILDRARRVVSLLVLAGVARLTEITVDIGAALAPWPAPKSTATRLIPVSQQSPKQETE